jgi:hypothetical protein
MTKEIFKPKPSKLSKINAEELLRSEEFDANYYTNKSEKYKHEKPIV